MKLQSSFFAAVCISLFAFSTVFADNAGIRGEAASEETSGLDVVSRSADTAGSDRDLQLVSTICSTISALLPGEVMCDCVVTLTIAFECAFVNPVCTAGNFCATPTISGALNIVTREVTFSFCVADATNAGAPAPSFCVAFTAIIPANTNIQSTNAKAASVKTCQATVGGRSCKSCDICGKGSGYVFDCSKFDAQLTQSECTPVRLISNLRKDQKITFLPNLDSV